VVETNKSGSSLSMSHLAARQEVRDLLSSLRIPAIDARIQQVRTGINGDPLTAPRIAPKNAPAPAAEKVEEAASEEPAPAGSATVAA